MKAFAQEPGDPQTSLPSTLRLATHYYTKYNRHSARRPARRGVPIDQSTMVDLWWILVRARVHVIDQGQTVRLRETRRRGGLFTLVLYIPSALAYSF